MKKSFSLILIALLLLSVLQVTAFADIPPYPWDRPSPSPTAAPSGPLTGNTFLFVMLGLLSAAVIVLALILWRMKKKQG